LVEAYPLSTLFSTSRLYFFFTFPFETGSKVEAALVKTVS